MQSPPKRNLPLLILAFIAGIGALHVARPILVPFCLALLFRFLTMPALRFLKRLRIGAPAAATLILLGIFFAIGVAISQLAAPASQWASKIPAHVAKLDLQFAELRKSVKSVAETADKLSSIGAVDERASVVVEQPSSMAAILSLGQSALTQFTLVIVFLFFMLAYGDELESESRPLIERYFGIATRAELVRSIEVNVSRYLSTITAINIVLAVVEVFALALLGVPNALLWGVMAGVLNFIPYIGALIGTAVVTMVAILSFETLTQVLVVPAVYYGITAIEGTFITPAILGQRFFLNPLLIFSWVTFWGWLWGPIGALMAMPILVTLQIIISDSLRLIETDPSILRRERWPGAQPGAESPEARSPLITAAK